MYCPKKVSKPSSDVWRRDYETVYRQLIDIETQLSHMRYQWGLAELTPQQLKYQAQHLTKSIADLTRDL